MVEKEFGRLQKNATTSIVIRSSEYKGTVGLDIREFVESDSYTGWTKSGVRIPISQICNLAQIVAAACKDLAEE